MSAAAPSGASPLKQSIESAKIRVEHFSKKVGESLEDGLERLYSGLLEAPKITLILMLLMAAWFANMGSSFQDQIEDDLEVFLPDGADSTDLLLEVREEWSTDIGLIYIQTSNARLGAGQGYNVTDVRVLKEISWLEGDDGNIENGTYQRGLDWDKSDRGINDGILWVISPSQIIKEANSTDSRFNTAFCEQVLQERISLNIGCAERVAQSGTGGAYNIPDDQDRVDEIVERLSGSLASLAQDTNEDGIWDTAVIVIGLHHEMNITGEWDDFEDFFIHIDSMIDSENRPIWMLDEPSGTSFKQTGLTKVLQDVSSAIFEDLKAMMPISIVIVVLVITALHRSLKVVVISGLPIGMALAVTFGTTVLLDITLTPMIVACGPILIGLGVDYSLHMLNRIEECRGKILDQLAELNHNRRRQGLAEEPIPDLWDIGIYKAATLEMSKTTGVAVFISAFTTMVGFSVMIMPAIVPVIPIRTVGMTLVIGIMCTLIFSIILVPTLAWLLRYHKRENPSMWGKVGRVPVKHFLIIILITGAITSYGIINMDQLDKPITGTSDAPDGIDSLNTLATYSEQFGGGQTSMFIFDATQRASSNGTTQIRDLPVLDEMDRLEGEIIDNVNNTTTTSLITFLRSIPIVIEEENTGITLYNDSMWVFLHDECWTSEITEAKPRCTLFYAMDADPNGRAGWRADMVDIIFDSLSEEVRSMLLNSNEGKGLVYVVQPYLNLVYAGGLRDQIDDILLENNTLVGTSTSKLTGGLPVSLDINKGIHETQTSTTLWTMLILTLVLMAVFRSPRLGIITMIPVAVVILWQPLLMQSGDVNVNIFTAMIGTIVFGIGVDDAIHVMHRIREEGETPSGIQSSIEHTGQTIFETTVTTVGGLAAGFFVSFPGLENFFIMMMLLICFAFLTSVFLLPSILSASKTASAKIRGQPSWQDFGDTPILEEKVIEASLLD